MNLAILFGFALITHDATTSVNLSKLRRIFKERQDNHQPKKLSFACMCRVSNISLLSLMTKHSFSNH